MADYAEYLAVNVLNEERTVSYRILSRALKVHSNAAKQMLFDFYQKQITKKAGSLHATYLIAGTQRQRQSSQTNGNQSQDSQGDTIMPSSPFPASSAPEPAEDKEQQNAPSFIRLITLAKEEDLEAAKAQMDEIEAVHIYSLEPGPMKDIQVLTDCNRRVAAEFSEDPLQTWKQYGTIQNANVKRRTMNRGPPPTAAAPVAAKIQSKPFPATKKDEPKSDVVKEEKKEAAPKPVKETSEPETGSAASSQKSNTSKPATLKRDSSSIFKSFAKTKPKAAKPESQPSVEASPAISDDEADEDSMMVDDEPSKEATKEPNGKSKKDREDELKKMMEAEDEPMEDAEAEPEDEPEPEPVVEAPKDEPKDEVTVTNGRRRGRRRIMKKKTVKDEEGYLVTKEEAAWESFSEEEPAPPAKKAKASAPAPAPAPKAGAKKGGKGQGNIMSFFGKK